MRAVRRIDVAIAVAGVAGRPLDDTLVFIFDGEVLSPPTIQSLRITDEEITAFRFCTTDEAQAPTPLCLAALRRRPPRISHRPRDLRHRTKHPA